mgnify:FL=1
MVQQYLEHSKEILTSKFSWHKGGSKEVDIISLFGYQNEYDLREGFPLLTTKKMAVNSIIHELIWFLGGKSNIKYLVDNNVPIWDKDVFNSNLPKMVKEKLFPEVYERNSPEWNSALEDYMKMMRNTPGFIEKWGDAGPIYGPQWRSWSEFKDAGIDIVVDDKTYRAYIKDVRGIDQISDLIKKMKKNPTGKKHIVSAWNVANLPNMSLPPCHVLFQVNANEGLMDLQLYQRSCDQFLGVPFNIASYVMMNQIIANELGFQPRRFIHAFGDAHFYCGKNERGQWYGNNFKEFQKRVRDARKMEETTGNKQEYLEILDWVNKNAPPEREDEKGYDHVTGILEQLANNPQSLSALKIAKKSFKELTIDDFVVEGYKTPYRFIKREMAS